MNRPGEVAAAVRSALAQDGVELEVIVSSDGPPPEGLAASIDDPRLRITCNPGPPGATANLLHAIGLATGELLALLDDDDRWEPGFLATLLPAFDDPAVGVAFCDYALILNGREIPRPWPGPTGHQPTMLAPLLDRSIPPSAALMRRTTFDDGEALLPLAAGLAGAATIWLRAAAQGWAFQHVRATLVGYGMHVGQMSWASDVTAARFASTLERLRFDADPVAERMRRSRLAEAYCTQAGIALRRGRPREAGRLARRAARHDRLRRPRNLLALSGVRRFAARSLPQHPQITAIGLPIWQRIRPRPG